MPAKDRDDQRGKCDRAVPGVVLGEPSASSQFCNVYVDGFNLYYGCLKGTSYKWLDLEALCALLLPNYDVKRIRYFTARISGRPDQPDSPIRQDAYLRALASRPKVTIHYGKFLQSTVRMPLAAPQSGGPKTVEVIKTEEKGSDVNLATYLLLDAFRKDSDAAVVISNDSDLCEPIRIVQNEFKMPVGLLIPHSRPSEALRRLNPAFVKQIRRGPLSASQLPAKLTGPRSRTITKPAAW
jgi:NYN domain